MGFFRVINISVDCRLIIYVILGLVASASIYELFVKNGNDSPGIQHLTPVIKYESKMILCGVFSRGFAILGEVSLPMEAFRGFSLINNYKKLVTFTPGNENSVIHTLKVLAMLFVIYGHRFFFSMGFPMFDTERIEIVSEHFHISHHPTYLVRSI